MRVRCTSCAHPNSQEFTCFSYDDEHQLHLDDRSLRWYYPPQELPADLSRGVEGFDAFDPAGAVDEHLDSLLAAVAAHEQATQARIDAHVVTWRGMMTKVRRPLRPRLLSALVELTFRLWPRHTTIAMGAYLLHTHARGLADGTASR